MSVTEARIQSLEKKFGSKKNRMALESKHWEGFKTQSQYLGNGVYSWAGIYSTDTRELFLLGILGIENIYQEKK